MDVDHPRTIRARIRERVRESDRRCDERARAETELLVADQELGLAVEDVERVDVVVVGVRVGAVEAGLELELDQAQLVTPDLDRRDTIVGLETFTLARAEEDRVGCRGTGAGRNIDAVEAARLAAVARAQVLGKTAVGRVEVEEACARRAPEAVDDPRRCADAGVRIEQLLVVPDENCKSTLEDVKRIRMMPVVVRHGSVARIRKQRLGDGELVEVSLDHDAAAEEHVALARSEHDSVHRVRV